MRRLNKSEQSLLFFLGLAIFVMGNLMVVPKLIAFGRSLNAQTMALKEQKLAADSWLKQGVLWEARDKWMKEARPLFTPAITPATLLNEMKDLSKAHSVQILEQNVLEGKQVPGCHVFAIRLRLTGQLKQMVDWLHALQTPSSFVECSAFVCQSKKRSDEMEWEITLSRYYTAPKS